MIKYIKGDVLNSPQLIIAHQVNMQGVMGSGIAKAIKDKYPEAYHQYRDQLRSTQISLGNYGVAYTTDGKRVMNIFSQDTYLPRGERHTSYDALDTAFRDIKKYYAGDIAMPKIGCGLGGGDWKIVEAIIESVFNDRDIYIYEL